MSDEITPFHMGYRLGKASALERVSELEAQIAELRIRATANQNPPARRVVCSCGRVVTFGNGLAKYFTDQFLSRK
tara:strand:+ start:169 stop:393 length:225 start_codon:yes stop_codon:yes gene_type:complete